MNSSIYPFDRLLLQLFFIRLNQHNQRDNPEVIIIYNLTVPFVCWYFSSYIVCAVWLAQEAHEVFGEVQMLISPWFSVCAIEFKLNRMYSSRKDTK